MSTISAGTTPPARTGQHVHPVDRVLPPGQLFALGLQHVLAMYAGTIAVPLILAGVLKLSSSDVIFIINANLFASGIATLIQTLGLYKLPIGIKLPIMQGTTFAALTPMILIGTTHGSGIPGLLTIYGAVIVAGIVTMIISPFYSRFLLRFFPPLVTGTIVTVIGLSLMPVAVGWAGGGVGAKNFGAPIDIGLALLVLVLILCMSRFFKGLISRASILLGLLIGTIIAIPLGLTDFSGVGNAAWIGLSLPFHYGLPTFDLAAIAAMIVVMLVTIPHFSYLETDYFLLHTFYPPTFPVF